jgi:hypothetical protein
MKYGAAGARSPAHPDALTQAVAVVGMEDVQRHMLEKSTAPMGARGTAI